MSSVKEILGRLQFNDDAGVQRQLNEQVHAVRKRLSLIGRKILVLSGKGGVGKSTVTSQLALALGHQGKRVGVLDCDLNGPSTPRMLGLSGKTLIFNPSGAVPPSGPYGIKVASLSFLSDPKAPVRWKGPLDLTPVWLGMMESAVIREMLSDVDWGELDYLLFDLPPGAAADKPPAIVNLVPDLTGAVVVTTSSAVTQEVVRKSILYAQELAIPLLGLVENMTGLYPGSVDALADEFGLEVLLRVPHNRELASSLDLGIPLPEEHPLSRGFADLAKHLNALKPRTPPPEDLP